MLGRGTGVCVVHVKMCEPGTNKQFLGLILTAARLLAAGAPCQISHTGQAPARVVWKAFACWYCIAGALYPLQ
jgi:hypothetical protein